jgi:hypothetical protein
VGGAGEDAEVKINMPKRTPAQLRKREGTLVEELCAYHGYMFADTLPDRDKSTMMMSRVGKKTRVEMALAFKIMVPIRSALGRQIAARRARVQADKRKKSEARKMRPLHKIGSGTR